MTTVASPDHDEARTTGQESGGTHHLKDVLHEIEHDLILTALPE